MPVRRKISNSSRSLFDRVAETEQHIEMNIAVPRCLEVLCDDLGRKLRPQRDAEFAESHFAPPPT